MELEDEIHYDDKKAAFGIDPEPAFLLIIHKIIAIMITAIH